MTGMAMVEMVMSGTPLPPSAMLPLDAALRALHWGRRSVRAYRGPPAVLADVAKPVDAADLKSACL